MSDIKLGPTTPVGASDIRFAGLQRRSLSPSGKSEAPQGAVATSEVLDPGQPPIDSERVTAIRKAIENGSYPVIPTRIADAMIAAGIMLRSGRP